MRQSQLPNYTSDITEYLQDVDAAVTVLREEEHIDWLLLNGHYRGLGGGPAVGVVFLNSPFLDMNIPAW
jgi:hypothetical protein